LSCPKRNACWPRTATGPDSIMGTTTAAAAAMVARRQKEAQAAAAAANAKRSAQAAEARRKHAEYEREVRSAVAEGEKRLRDQIDESNRRWFDKHDADGSGTLSREELRNLLAEMRPEEPPTEGALDLLLAMCGEAATEVPRTMLLDVTGRYTAFLEEKQALNRFLKQLDTNGSGRIEQHELEAVLNDVGAKLYPPYAPTESDVAFLYAACRVDFGEPILPGPSMLLLKPALSEWKRMIEKRQYEERCEAYRKRKQASRACVLL